MLSRREKLPSTSTILILAVWCCSSGWAWLLQQHKFSSLAVRRTAVGRASVFSNALLCQPDQNKSLDSARSLRVSNGNKKWEKNPCTDTVPFFRIQRTEQTTIARRVALSQLGHLAILLGSVAGAPSYASAEAPRQLELCLVSVLRITYWAQGLSQRIKSTDPERQRQAYLEARLGAKAALTGGRGVVGTPPNAAAAKNIYVVSTLQLPGCLRDLQEVHNTQLQFANICRDFYESLASLVEFDGMDTLQDPSPRSTFTVSQWNDKKNRYVQRMLQERVVLLGYTIVRSFPPQAQSISRDYVQQFYPDELPPEPPSLPPPAVIEDEADGPSNDGE